MWVRILFVIVAVLGLGTSYAGPPKLPLLGPQPSLTLTPLAPPAQRTSGRLTWLSGARLTSDDPAFGGFSALSVQGGRFTLLNDGGNYVTFGIGSGWRSQGVRFGALPDGPATGWEKRDRDSESLAIGPGGQLWVGFERANQIWRYAPGFARAEGRAAPLATRNWRSNGGAESLARLRDGRFVALAETSRWQGQPGRAGIVFAGDPVAAPERGFRFTYLPAPGFDPDDVAVLPDGDLLVLERRWLLPLRFRLRIVRVRASDLRPGAQVAETEVGRIIPPWPTENYEGITITREGTATIVWLVSDNDQMSSRESYLLKLRLD